MNNIKQLNKIIESYFETFNEKTNKTINNVKSLIGNDSKKKKIEDNRILTELKTYCNKRIGIEGQDLVNEIYEDIFNSAESLGDILLKKGLINFFQSLVSNYSYLENIINIIIDKYLERINNTISILKDSFKDFTDNLIHQIVSKSRIYFMKLDKEKLKIWNDLSSFYGEKKIIIIQVKKDLWAK